MDENQRKHLEFIQLIITRMNVNSFMVKGWIVTIVAALFVLSSKDASKSFLYFAPFATILFWILDAFYVSTERQYRALYDYVRKQVATDFSMKIEAHILTGKESFFRCLLSLSLLLFYPLIVIGSLIAATYLNK